MTEAAARLDDTSADPPERALVMRFESLGGAGHGCEFGLFQRHYDAEPLSLLRWADMAPDLLIQALESRFDGVGEAEHTVIFTPDGSDEWWTRDKRYWMAMRSFVKVADMPLERMTVQVLRRLQFLRGKLIEDLGAGEKIFVFKDMFQDLNDDQLHQLHAAVRSYGNCTLLYIRYADDANPAGSVHWGGPGLLIGYVNHFTFSRQNEFIAPVHDVFLALCREAWRLHIERRPSPAVLVRSSKVQRPRKIVLFGNCQMQAMTQLYEKFVAVRTGDQLKHVASYEDLSDQDRQMLEEADLVVEQLLDLAPKADAGKIGSGTPRLYMPMVTAAFLWPFAGQPHPRNEGTPFLPGGPYVAEASDSFLNRLILANTPAEEAVETYLSLDVAKRANLDRLFELVMDRQRARDDSTGYRIAELIEAYFRTEQIFLSPYHPNTRIAVALATQFFRQLGAATDDIDRMQARTRVTPFPKDELPVHPSVASHWGLAWAVPERRYRFMNEGRFTIREYARRYMGYEWNDALEEGLALTHQGQHKAAIERLRFGLEKSPLSAAGHNALGHLLYRTDAKPDAIAAARRAVALEPDDASYRASLGNMLRETGQRDEAEVALRAAVRLDPAEPRYLVLLSHLLRECGREDEALDAVAQAVALEPWSVDLRLDLTAMQEAKQDWAAAAGTLQTAISLDGPTADLCFRLALALMRLNRNQEALDAAHAGQDAEIGSPQLRQIRSECLLRCGRIKEALIEAYRAVVSNQRNGEAYAHLGHVLRAANDQTAAEQARLRATEIEPSNARFRHELDVLRSQMHRPEDAILAARDAAERDPTNPSRWAHLAHVAASANAWQEAQSAQRKAAQLAPDDVDHQLILSDLFAREGRLQEALVEAQIAVDRVPDSGHALGHLAHIEQLMGNLAQAEERLQKAMRLAPGNDHLRQRHELLLARIVTEGSVATSRA